MRVYKPSRKHKPGAVGDGPPRWFPDADSLCPEGFSLDLAQELLDHAVEGVDLANPNARALYSLHDGMFLKAYSEGCDASGDELWHAYPVRTALVPKQVPARVLKKFVGAGKLSRAEYKKLLGSAR